MGKCPICKSERNVLIWHEKKYRIFKCENCNVSFLHPVPKNPEKIYNREYFEKWYLKYYRRRKEYLRKLWERVKPFIIEKGKALDIGCGIGIFLEILKEDGWEAYGQEISPFAIDFCKKKGFKIYTRPLDECDIPSDSFDLITMWDVIAHLKNPVLYLEICRKILKKNGTFVIKTPLHPMQLFLFSNLFSFTGKSKSLINVPSQIFHFDKKSIKNLFYGENLSVETIMVVDDFKIRFTIYHFLKMFEKSLVAVGKKDNFKE